MTLTVKESPELVSAGKPNPSGPVSRPNPVCLEVPVTVRSLPGQQDDASGSTAPIREEGRTVIVFDNGAVLRLSNSLPDGQTVILSNSQSRDVVCRVVNTRNLPNVKGYVEVEFIEPVNDFWRIHQTEERASGSNAPPPVPAPAQHIPIVKPSPVPEPVRVTAPEVAAPITEPSNGPGSAPSFDDIAGLVRMSPPATVREKGREKAPQPDAQKAKDESKQRAVDTSRPISPVSLATPISDTSPFPSASIRNHSSSNALSSDFPEKDMLSSVQGSSVFTPSESRSRMPLIVGGAAVVLVICAGLFFMRKGTATSQSARSVTETQPLTPAAPTAGSATEPTQTAQVAVDQLPASVQEPAPSNRAVPADGKKDSTSSVPEADRSSANTVDATQTRRADTRRQQVQNLKMSSPTTPRQNLAGGSDEIASNITDAASSVAVGGALPAVIRSETQPAPPPSSALPAPVAPGKAIREAKVISSVPPVYPSVAKQSNAQGRVVITAEVDATGKVLWAKALDGPMLLRQAAIDAVKQWKYEPAYVNGRAGASMVTVNIDFSLK